MTKDDNWINSNDLRGNFDRICGSIPNDQLRHEIFNYFKKSLPKPHRNKNNSQKEISLAVHNTIKQFPEIIKYYVKKKKKTKSERRIFPSKK